MFTAQAWQPSLPQALGSGALGEGIAQATSTSGLVRRWDPGPCEGSGEWPHHGIGLGYYSHGFQGSALLRKGS